MRNTVSIDINRPIDEVFRLTTNHVEEWSIVVVEDEVIAEKPEGVGTTFRTVTEDRGKRMEFEGVITRFDPPRASAIRLINKILVIETEFSFEDLGTATRVTQTATVSGRGFTWLLMIIFGWLMNKSNCDASRNELESLKRFCEANKPSKP